MTNRITAIKEGLHWSDSVADEVLGRFPDLELYTCAAGISPSGIVHFGNFRDVMTSLCVADALKRRGKKVRMLFSWDEYDRFRKVPAGIQDSYRDHIGKPLTDVPDPSGEFPSYARRFEAEFERAMEELGIELDYRFQTNEHRSGRYDEKIIHALKKREEIAHILLGFMSDKGKREKEINEAQYIKNFYPINIYSRFSGKDTVQILNYDGDSTVEYRCVESGKTDLVDLRKDRIAKLAWKIDWPMRWTVEGVVFEPGGHDHASPGGSYDVSSSIVRAIFNGEPPLFIGYQFVGIQGLGVKMSGSKGNATSPAQLLEIYEPELLQWLYTRKEPEQGFSLAFDAEVIRQYDELDREVVAYNKGELPDERKRALEIAYRDQSKLSKHSNPIPFKQAVALGQILQWDGEKVVELSSKLGMQFSAESVANRLPKARRWLESYNQDAIIKLNDSFNSDYASKITPEGLEHIRQLRDDLNNPELTEIETIETLVYQIPKKPELDQKENAKRQRAFFKDVYQLLVGNDAGPRLSTFLWAVDRKRVIELLTIPWISLPLRKCLKN